MIDTQQREWLDIWDRKFAVESDESVHARDGFENLSDQQWNRLADYCLGKCGITVADDVLEVGCGAGAILDHIPEYKSLAGVDYSAGAIAIARQRLEGRFEIAEADKLPFADNEFDCVFVWSVWQYFPSEEYAERALAEMIRVSKPGARIFIGDVNDASKKEIREGRIENLESKRKKVVVDSSPGHMFYDKDFFARLAKKYNKQITIFNEDKPELDFYTQSRWRFSVLMENSHSDRPAPRSLACPAGRLGEVGTRGCYKFTEEEINRLSKLSRRRWKKARPGVVQKPPFDLEARAEGLREAYDILEKLKIRFWLTGGSLLGAVRENDFIPWDDDVDMDMLKEEFVPVMHKIKEELMKAGFVVRLTDKGRFPKMAFFKYGQKYALGALLDEGEWRVRPAYKYPGKFFKNEKRREFKGRDFLVPSPPEKFLEHVYGDWRTPIKSDVDEEFYNPDHFISGDRWLRLRKLWVRIKKYVGI
jgi:ubiquinone/menaquinone biosynthesis C-methylase UbiE